MERARYKTGNIIRLCQRCGEVVDDRYHFHTCDTDDTGIGDSEVMKFMLIEVVE